MNLQADLFNEPDFVREEIQGDLGEYIARWEALGWWCYSMEWPRAGRWWVVSRCLKPSVNKQKQKN